MSAPEKHIPVLYGELIESLHFFDKWQNVIIDATLWLWGHASGVIEKLGTWDIFIGLDCDEDNLKSSTARLLTVLSTQKEQPTVYCIHSNFSELDEVLSNIWNYEPINKWNKLNKLNKITSLYADLGVSSVHFDTAERWFSFRFDGPLDMRLDTSNKSPFQGGGNNKNEIRGYCTAAEMVNTLPYDKMAETFRIYGDESRAGFIAKKIIEAREIAPIETTKQLAEIVTKAWKDSLPRIFQALRIAVNDEYGALRKLLETAHDKLASEGTISIISFHSGEDRIVKHFFREKSEAIIDPITGQDMTPWTLEVLTRKPITPTESEIERNPRARSALLRVAKKK
jgi:16S rRNA (cytosine1402-N4)-methyltransferase